MDLTAEERPSDSPFVERIWHNRSDEGGTFTSMAQTHWGIAVTKLQSKTIMTIRGPETKSSAAYCPPDAEFFGIMFKAGTLMPHWPAQKLMDRNDVNLPEAGSQSFWLNGSAWDFPNIENADTFVERLVKEGLLLHDPLVSAVLDGELVDMSLRTVQRRFLQATGLTHNTIYQINRARQATNLLKQGVSILDTVDLTGYADQAHLTRSLKHFVGQTPAQIAHKQRQEKLSFLFNTTPV